MKQIQKSLSFLTPAFININKYPVTNTYLGDVTYYGDDRWGEHFFIEFGELSDIQLKELRAREDYVFEYYPTTTSTIIVLSIPEEIKTNIVIPFIDGKYSEIDRKYVRNNFSRYTSFGNLSINFLILHKSSILKKYWEEQIGVELPENAEVWSRPEKKDEVLNYPLSVNT